MNIEKLTKSFKYSGLLANKDLKKFKQNFDKHKPNIDLYSTWDFHPLISDFNPKLFPGKYILLGLINENDLIFLEYIDQINIAPYDSYINQISIKDFIKQKHKNIIQLIHVNEELIYKYINSYFNKDPFLRKFL